LNYLLTRVAAIWIEKVTFEKTTYNALPFKFEAGTMNLRELKAWQSFGLCTDVGRKEIAAREQMLLDYATRRLSAIKGLRIYGNSADKISTISFLVKDIHQYDTGTILDKLGIAVRTGTHCAQPVMDRFGIEGTVRASMCFYNTTDEIDVLGTGIEKVISMFSK
jgi:cysteine desulfurase/selenocysteine lyase